MSCLCCCIKAPFLPNSSVGHPSSAVNARSFYHVLQKVLEAEHRSHKVIRLAYLTIVRGRIYCRTVFMLTLLVQSETKPLSVNTPGSTHPRRAVASTAVNPSLTTFCPLVNDSSGITHLYGSEHLLGTPHC